MDIPPQFPGDKRKRVCPVCLVTKDLNIENFHRDRRKWKHGFHTTCKKCRLVAKKQKYHNNPEHRAVCNKFCDDYYRLNSETILKQRKIKYQEKKNKKYGSENNQS